MSRIAVGSHVTLHYRMALLVDGQECELVNTFAGKPATLQMGVGQWSPGLEEGLLGLEEGADVQFELPPERAYGVRRGELVREFPRAQLDARAEPGWRAEAGEPVELRGPGGAPLRGTLVCCDEVAARIDFNHPLAGLPMRVQVRVIGVL